MGAYVSACGMASIHALEPSILRSASREPHTVNNGWAAETLYKNKIRKIILHDRVASAHTVHADAARAGTTCPTTARAMIAIVEEASFITADLSGKLQNVDESIPRF